MGRRNEKNRNHLCSWSPRLEFFRGLTELYDCVSSQDEIFDMVKPVDPYRISLQDLISRSVIITTLLLEINAANLVENYFQIKEIYGKERLTFQIEGHLRDAHKPRNKTGWDNRNKVKRRKWNFVRGTFPKRQAKKSGHLEASSQLHCYRWIPPRYIFIYFYIL